MSFDWAEYLRLAKELAKNPPPNCDLEAIYRTVIGRAYYGAFREAQNFLVKRGSFSVEFGEGSHNKVIFEFKGHPNRYCQLIGEDLRRMKQFRERADYQDEFEGSLENAVDLVVDRAEKIMKRLKQI